MLNKRQQEILDNPSDVIFVEAAAASGKTRLLVEKIKKEVGADKGTVVAFTFTNNAAEEIMDRLNEIDHSRLFIGTIHAYCYRLLMSNNIIEAAQYVEDGEFDSLFELLKKHQNIIEDNYCVLCDEMQDCNMSQFDLMFKMMRWKKFFACYDKRQSIYRWRDAHPEYIDDYINTHPEVSVEYMMQNYRNGQEILRYAKSLIRMAGDEYLDESIAMCTHAGVVQVVDYSPSAIARGIQKATLSDEGNYGSWMVLTRTNDQLAQISSYLNDLNIPNESFKRAQLDNATLKQKMNDNTVKVLTIHSAKGLEADNVVVIGAQFFNLEEKCISYVGATRAKKILIWASTNWKKAKSFVRINNWEE